MTGLVILCVDYAHLSHISKTRSLDPFSNTHVIKRKAAISKSSHEANVKCAVELPRRLDGRLRLIFRSPHLIWTIFTTSLRLLSQSSNSLNIVDNAFTKALIVG